MTQRPASPARLTLAPVSYTHLDVYKRQVVVRDELLSGALQEYAVIPHLFESFYAITVQRHFEPPLLKELLQRDEADVLGKAGIAQGS